MCMYHFLLSQISLILCSLFSFCILVGGVLMDRCAAPSFLSPAISVFPSLSTFPLFLYYVSVLTLYLLFPLESLAY